MRPKQNSGFTLIEVLIAFTILALVLGVIFPTLSSGLSHERIARLATARMLEARSILDGLGVDTKLEQGTIGGELATGDVWTLTVSQIEPDTKDAGPSETDRNRLNAYLAELQIDGADGRTLRLQTLKLGP
ncbi:MAG TPA: prepilin-type N-terminal cleavage/methylation domain-containing protein [Thermohalobaculum sp.]|nr:prepilin-type N-terminal cleavage/methylation domain-containing protein [Thermohalobaculum sp.]